MNAAAVRHIAIARRAIAPAPEKRDAVFTSVEAWLTAEDLVVFARTASTGTTEIGLSFLSPAARLEECGLVTVTKRTGWVNTRGFGGEAWTLSLTERGRAYAEWRAARAGSAADRDAYVAAQVATFRVRTWERKEFEPVVRAAWDRAHSPAPTQCDHCGCTPCVNTAANDGGAR